MAIDNKEKEVLNVPPLRFPEFTGEWQCKTIEKVAPLQRGFDLPTQNLVEGIYPVIYSNGILQHHDKYKCEAPGLITGRSGTIGKFTYIDSGFYWPHNTSLWVTDFCGNCPKFIYYLYQTVHIEQFSTGSGVPTLNRNDVHRYKTSVPTAIVEQEKIAKFLSILDERIVTQNKIIEDLKKLKSAIIHRCYSSQTNMIPLSELLKQCSDRNRSGSDLQVLSVSNKYGFIAQSDQFEDREVASDDTSNYKVVKKGMFAYNPARINVGSIALYEMDSNGIVSPMYVCFTTKSELLPSYLKYYFASQTFKHEMYKRLEGSVRLCLTFEELCNIEIHLPSIEQQKNISKYISKIENNLSLVDSIFSKYQQQRRYLLSQMFI